MCTAGPGSTGPLGPTQNNTPLLLPQGPPPCWELVPLSLARDPLRQTSAGPGGLLAGKGLPEPQGPDLERMAPQDKRLRDPVSHSSTDGFKE